MTGMMTRIRVDSVRRLGRYSQGVKVQMRWLETHLSGLSL